MSRTDIYKTQSVTTAGPAPLVLMLYDRALVAITRARQATVAAERIGGLETVNHELQRAQDIVTELRVTLDHGRGGTVATNLDQLYGFCLDRLVRANVTKDVTDLAPVERVLQGLRDAWEQACCATPATVGSET